MKIRADHINGRYKSSDDIEGVLYIDPNDQTNSDIPYSLSELGLGYEPVDIFNDDYG